MHKRKNSNSSRLKSTKKQGGPRASSHEVISSQFREIFRQCSDWAKDYFNIKIVDFDISKFPGLKKELEVVSWDNSDWSSKKLFKASPLVQAVLGNMVYTRIFLLRSPERPRIFINSFDICTR